MHLIQHNVTIVNSVLTKFLSGVSFGNKMRSSDQFYLVLALLTGFATCHKNMLYVFSDICSDQSCDTTNIVFVKKTRTRIECAAKCFHHARCRSFSFDVSTGQCSGYDKKHPDSIGSGSYAGMAYTCSNIYEARTFASSGEYTIFNDHQEPFHVYCDFHSGYGYTYISTDVSVAFNIDDLSTHTNHVMIRHLGRDGFQYEARIEQIEAYQDIPLSVQFNSYVNYTEPSNYALSPYIYLGFLPKASMFYGQIVGYKVNGSERTYEVIENNADHHIAFFFNHNDVPIIRSHIEVVRLQPWYTGSTVMPVNQYMADTFYSFFEIHFTGSGLFMSSDRSPLVGAAVGLRFDITCPEPINLVRTQTSVSGVTPGSTVTYTCDSGYTLLSGNSTRTCAVTGKWTGQSPVCG